MGSNPAAGSALTSDKPSQATRVVTTRRGLDRFHTEHPEDALAWLHSVATRTALRARTVADRRRRRETPVESLPDAVDRGAAPAEDVDLAAVVDEEIARLPDALRATVVLCEMESPIIVSRRSESGTE